jgi:serine protease AprX
MAKRLRGVLVGLAAGLTVLGLVVIASNRPVGSIGVGEVSVIVRAASVHRASEAVSATHGQVTRVLQIVDGVAATIPRTALGALASTPGVHEVLPDYKLHVQSVEPVRAGQASTDPRSVYGEEVEALRTRALGWSGQGVTVALLDTGISGPDLAARVKPVKNDVTGVSSTCVDLSGEGTCRDTYGHGTFMAGIIAGDGSSSGGKYTGIAPKANLVSIKVASADGSADVSTVLAGIQWAVSFKDRYGIKVLNLSLGTDSTQRWAVDPLNYAVERAWAAGIAVVVSASNRGPAPGTISKPADDPWVITVGAVDDRGTTSVSDDVSPDFSGRGPTSEGLAKPDLAAPGANLVSLRSVGSSIDNQYPQRIAGAYHQGSGTSMSAAVVSGAAALVLSAHPGMTPNRLKYSLTSTTRRAAKTDPMAVGSGVVDAYNALNAPAGQANAGVARSTGMGSLDLSRGSVLVQTDDPLHTVIRGSLTAQVLLWDPVGFVTGDWSSTTWYASAWATRPLFRTVWSGSNWSRIDATGCSTDEGHRDDCSYGDGHNWEGSAWYGSWG